MDLTETEKSVSLSIWLIIEGNVHANPNLSIQREKKRRGSVASPVNY